MGFLGFIFTGMICHAITSSKFQNDYPNNKINPTAKAATEIPMVI